MLRTVEKSVLAGRLLNRTEEHNQRTKASYMVESVARRTGADSSLNALFLSYHTVFLANEQHVKALYFFFFYLRLCNDQSLKGIAIK